tara:strand:+ start:249 stop:458 length:210 start_codon:yes stop_codon:yes gene_type:complete
MAKLLSDESIRHYVSTGQFNVVKLDNNKEYNTLINSYPSSWHNHIKQAFRFGCTDMINELMLKVKVTAL